MGAAAAVCAVALSGLGVAVGYAGLRVATPLLAQGGNPASGPVGAPVAIGLAPTGPDAGLVGGQVAPPGAAPRITLQRSWQAGASQGVVYDAELAGQLDAALARVDGRLGVAIKDLATGRGAVLDAGRELPSASLFKLPVLYSVFQADLPFTQELLITDEVKSFDLGTLELGAGETLSVAEALERMVTISDNSSAILLANAVGGPRVNADMAALGLDRTHYSTDRLTTSAGNMLDLLERIARGSAVSRTASAEMVHLLLRQRVNDRLPRLLPDEARVAHKTGNLPGVVNDVGIVYGPHSTFVVAAMVDDTTDEAGGAEGLARLAQTAYTYFEAQPERDDRPRIPPAPRRAIPPAWRQPRPTPMPTLTVEDSARAEPLVATPVSTGSQSTPTSVAAEVASVATGATPSVQPTAVRAAAQPTAPAVTAAPAAATQPPTPRPATPTVSEVQSTAPRPPTRSAPTTPPARPPGGQATGTPSAR